MENAPSPTLLRPMNPANVILVRKAPAIWGGKIQWWDNLEFQHIQLVSWLHFTSQLKQPQIIAFPPEACRVATMHDGCMVRWPLLRNRYILDSTDHVTSPIFILPNKRKPFWWLTSQASGLLMRWTFVSISSLMQTNNLALLKHNNVHLWTFGEITHYISQG